MRIVSLTIRDISSPSTKERCVSLTVFNWLKTVSNLIFYVFFFLTVSFDDQMWLHKNKCDYISSIIIQLLAFVSSSVRQLMKLLANFLHILLYADVILNRWVCSQCKHFQIYDKWELFFSFLLLDFYKKNCCCLAYKNTTH